MLKCTHSSISYYLASSLRPKFTHLRVIDSRLRYARYLIRVTLWETFEGVILSVLHIALLQGGTHADHVTGNRMSYWPKRHRRRYPRDRDSIHFDQINEGVAPKYAQRGLNVWKVDLINYTWNRKCWEE